MTVEHTFPPEVWELICAELAEQKQPSPLWAASVTSRTLLARDALRALYSSSKMLRCIAQPLLLQYYSTKDEDDGFGSFCKNITSKPQLASLVRGLEVAPSHLYAVDPASLAKVASRLGFHSGLFHIPAQPTPEHNKQSRVTDLSLLANLLPCLLPNLDCLQIRLGTHQDVRRLLKSLREYSIVKPFESITTLVLDAKSDMYGSPNGCMLEDYRPLLASLPNLEMLSLWNFKRVLASDNGRLFAVGTGPVNNLIDIVSQWLPKGLRSLHMQDCVVSYWAMIALLSNCRVLENLFYAPEAATSWLIFPHQAAAYYQIVHILRKSARDTIKHLDLDLGHFKHETWSHMLDSDLAVLWKDICRFPHVERVTVDGMVYQCKEEKTPQEHGHAYSSPSDWTLIKASGDVGERTRDFQCALDRASKL